MQISGSRQLHRLLYCSRQHPRLDIAAELPQLVASSARNNEAAGITGLLLILEGDIVQVLEGPTEAVQTTYGRIHNDRRHEKIRVLSAVRAERREFEGWATCARGLTPENDAILDPLARKGVFDPAKLTAPAALRLLLAVGEIQQRTATSACPAADSAALIP